MASPTPLATRSLPPPTQPWLAMSIGLWLTLAASASAQTTSAAPHATPTPQLTQELWPEGKMPGSGAKEPEHEVPAKSDGFHRITSISHPTLTYFPVNSGGQESAPAMIICPGGGYSYVVYDKEGTEIAAWLNSKGISAFVLKYRTPHNRDGALQDIQRAVSLVRTHATEWHVTPNQIGVIGFSAGGNLVAKASNRFDDRTYPKIDAADEQSCRPDFAILVYPAYLNDKEGHVASDLNLKAHIPPTLIIHNEDDKTFVVGSKIYDAALTEAKIPHQFKLYQTGGHGYGLHCDREAKIWPEDATAWLHSIGIR